MTRRNPLYSIILFSLAVGILYAACPAYLENCQTCTAEVYTGTVLTTLSQCSACTMGNLSYNHLTVSSNKSEGCRPCHYRCRVCASQYDTQCTTCEAEYYLANNNTCQPCQLANCMTCSSSGSCSACMDGYYLSSDGSLCVSCSAYNNSATCRQNIIVTCKSGFYVLNGEVCMSCISNCLSCSNSASCTTCADGYFGSNCTQCSSNCVSCRSLTLCLSCQIGYYLNSGFSCSLCNLTSCDTCYSNGTCKSCQTGFYLNSSGSCVAVNTPSLVANCKYYSSSSLCSACKDGYYLEGTNCKFCSLACATCSGSHFGTCLSCQSNTKVFNSQCLPVYNIGSGISVQDFITAKNSLNRIMSDMSNAPTYLCQDYMVVGSSLQISLNQLSAYKMTIKWRIYQINSTTNKYWCSFNSANNSYFSKLNSPCGNNTFMDANSSTYTSVVENNTLVFGVSSSGSTLGISQIIYITTKCSGSQCLVCLSTTQCTQCKIPTYYKQAGDCVYSCGSAYYSRVEELQCYTTCPAGTFAFDDNKTCLSCPSSCLTCYSSIYCMSCANGYYLFNNTCLSTCPATFFMNNNTKNCDKCAYPCLNCNSTLFCLSCANNFLYNGSCVATCPDTYYADFLSLQCLTCSNNVSNCLNCLSSTICLSCISKYYLLNKTCIASCPDRYYANTNNICLACQYRCKTCNSSSTDCTSCAAGFLYNRTCVNSCPSSYYADLSTLQCSVCSSSCLACENSSTICTLCSNSSALFNSSCITDCPSTYYKLSSSTNSSSYSCSKCVYPCATCSNSTLCLSCTSGFINNGSCVTSDKCPNGTYADNTNKSCLACSQNCMTCQYDSITCKTCNSTAGLTLDVLSNTCVSDCPAGQYNSVPPSSTCLVCSPNCLTCSKASSNCTSCFDTFTLQNGSCLNYCTQGFYKNITTNNCEKCDSKCSVCTSSNSCQLCAENYYLSTTVNSSMVPCVTTCEDGYYADFTSKLCIKCSLPCKNCLSSVRCLSCASGILNGVTCVLSCPAGTLLNQSLNSCIACDSSCLTCSGNIGSCTSCNSPLILYNSTCISTCPTNGTYLDVASNSCLNCSYPCSTCSGSSSYCLSCVDKFLDGSTCYDFCPLGKYPDTILKRCNVCVSPCQYCSDQSTCLTCVSGYFLEFNDSCVAACQAGEYGQDGVCQSCVYPCQTCTDTHICTSCLTGNLVNGSCPGQCIYGTTKVWISAINSYECLNCDSACANCINSTSYCLKCSNSSLMAFEGKCIAKCPDSYFNSAWLGTCSRCIGDCKSCTSQISCTSCISGYLLNSSCVKYCPDRFFQDKTHRTCEACQPPCVNCFDSTFCLSCQEPLLLYNYECLEQCPSHTFLQTESQSCVACGFPCKTCNTAGACSSCLGGFLMYRSTMSICVEGPTCPHDYYVMMQTQECITLQDCLAPNYIQQQGRMCRTECVLPYLYLQENRTCVSACPDGTSIDATLRCRVITDTRDRISNMNSEFVVLNNSLEMRIHFSEPVRYVKQVQPFWMSVRFVNQLRTSRLLQEQGVFYTPNFSIIEQNPRYIRATISAQRNLDFYYGEVNFDNYFLTNIRNIDSNMPLQDQTVRSPVVPYDYYSSSQIGMGFEYMGQIVAAVVFIIGLFFLGTNNFHALYGIIDLMQLLYLLGFLDIQYPPNIRELFLGFKNSHLYYFPSMFSGVFDDNYIEFSASKFRELSLDISFLRNAAHVFTVGIIVLGIYFVLRCFEALLNKYAPTKNPDQKLLTILHNIIQAHTLFKWSYIADITLTLTSIMFFFGFAQMNKYSQTPISQASAALSIASMLAFASLYVYLYFKVVSVLRKQQRKSNHDFIKKIRSRPNLACFLGSIDHHNNPLALYTVHMLFFKKIMFSILIALCYDSPLFCLSALSICCIMYGFLCAYFKPYYESSYNYVLAGSEFSVSILLLFLSILQFNKETMDSQSKWVLGWFCVVAALVSVLSLFLFLGYKLITKGYERKYLEAEEQQDEIVELPQKDEELQSSGSALTEAKRQQRKYKKQKVGGSHSRNSEKFSDLPLRNELITYEPSEPEDKPNSDTNNTTGMPKLLIKCYKYPVPENTLQQYNESRS